MPRIIFFVSSQSFAKALETKERSKIFSLSVEIERTSFNSKKSGGRFK